jgi:hypothetical protein
MKYAEEWKARRDESEDAVQFRLDSARDALAGVLASLKNPVSSTGVDQDGDATMGDGETKADGNAEVITIPLSIEDELSDIPAEMRETVASEIAAFRDRSNRRDLERLRKEEELEAMERQRNTGSRVNRLASPPSSAPSGPAGGANGIPLGPRDKSVAGAPSGPKGQGVQIPKDYQNGVAFTSSRDEDDSDASDEELERRRQEKKEAEMEKMYLDQERRWLNRERSRTAAVEREKNRDKDEEASTTKARDAMARRLKEWDDDAEASRRSEEYYADRSLWGRNRLVFRRQEAEADDRDRAMERREKARDVERQEHARGMADTFLDRQAEEIETKAQQPAAPAPREPQRFKMSLGASAAQRAQAAAAARPKRTAAEVEGLLEDEEEGAESTRRTLRPITFDPASSVSAGAADMTEEERAQAARQLAGEIPTDKDGLWAWEVKWEFVDDAVIREQIKPFVEKKIVEYLGVQEQMLVDVVEEHVKKRGDPQELVGELEEVSLYPFPRLSHLC